MSSIWGALGKSALQDLIGSSVIDRLESILPGLVKDYDNGLLFTKEGLIKVFDAFFGAASLLDKEFRTQFFNSLPPGTIDGLLAAAKINAEGLSFEDKIVRLAKKSWDDGEYAEKAIKLLGLPLDYMPAQKKGFVAQESLLPPESAYKPLKEYQYPIHEASIKRLESPRSRFVVQMPTGSGKTRTAIEIICSYLNSSAENAIVVWLAHSEELCEQAADSFLEIWPHVAKHELHLIRCWGAEGKLPAIIKGRSFIVGGFSKVYGVLARNPVLIETHRSRVGLVIVDEAHKVIAPTYETATRAFIGENTSVIGLTATPGRSVINTDENEELAKFFFMDLLSIQSGEIPVISYLREKGVLSHVDYEPLETHRSFELTSKEKGYLEKFYDLPPGFLNRLGTDDVRNVEIIKKIEKEVEAKGRIIFFACSVDHSKFVCAVLKFLGIAAAHIDGDTPRAQRAASIAAFRSGSIRVLCNYGVLSTGFDAPKTDVVFIARPTQSIVLYSQMIGRGLRGPAIGGTESCKVIDVVDNIAGFSNQNRVYDYFEDYFDGSR
jgi:DNA repair protein RadD